MTSAAQARELESQLKCQHRDSVPVVVGMRYGEPSITTALADLRQRGVDRILAVPMYPQYAGATTGSLRSPRSQFSRAAARYVDAGDVYASQCAVSAQLIAEKCDWPASRVTLAYQSKFGREPGIGPATDATMHQLAKSRARVAVMCPGFTADCLETLEEIAITGRERFMEAGGAELCVVPALNLHPVWLDALAAIARAELGGWV